MVVHQFDRDIAVRQQLDVVVQLASGNRARSRLFYLRCAAGSQALVEIGRSDRQLVVTGLKQKVRQDWYRRLPLNDALRGGQLPQQLRSRNGDLEVAGWGCYCGRLGHLGLLGCARHGRLSEKSVLLSLAKLYTESSPSCTSEGTSSA